MTAPALVVMAAGMGSRYGGLKQIDPIGPHGEIILDYSVFDALRGGFGQVVFIIRRDLETAFREKIGRAVEAQTDVAYVFQEVDSLPGGRAVPAGRGKPWGTGHAVLSCREAVTTPFAVISADDFYGRTSFSTLGQYLATAADAGGVYDFCMLGYALQNTLSEHGTVARGVCEVTADGDLRDIHERTRIQRRPAGIQYTENDVDWVTLAPETIVSMTAWGFTPSIFAELATRFETFLARPDAELSKAEFFLPDVVSTLVRHGQARVKVLPTNEAWFGVTYQQDRPIVQDAIRDLVAQGMYPAPLWGQPQSVK